MGGFAWVTLATNDSYSLGALVLAHSLRRVGTKHDLAVLVTPGVTGAMREKLSSVFSLVQEVNVLDSKDETNLALLARPELGITFTKLHCWRLTQYEKCVFVDADTLVIRNCDELFEREELSAAPDVGWPDCFNSGVFVFKPSQQTFASITTFAAAKGSFDGGDQGLLNQYFSDWAHKDISKHLPFIYNMCSTATYSYLPAFKQFGDDVRIIHFIGSTKPWLQYFDTITGQVQPTPGSNHLQPLLQLWWNIFCENVHPQLSPVMAHISTLASDWHELNPIPSVPNNPRTFNDNVNDCTYNNVESYEPDFSEFKDPWENYNQESNVSVFNVEAPTNSNCQHNYEHKDTSSYAPSHNVINSYSQASNATSQNTYNDHTINIIHDHSQNHCSHREEHDVYKLPSVLDNSQNNETQDNSNVYHEPSVKQNDDTIVNYYPNEYHYTENQEHAQNSGPYCSNNYQQNCHHIETINCQYNRNEHRHQDESVENICQQRDFHLQNEKAHTQHYDQHHKTWDHSVDNHSSGQTLENFPNIEQERVPKNDFSDREKTPQQQHKPHNQYKQQLHSEEETEENRLENQSNADDDAKQTDVLNTVKSQSHLEPCTKSKCIATQSEPKIARQLESNDAGIAGALAKITLGEARSPEQVAFEEHMRKQSWEQGQIDYMGRDSFENIWKKISETLAVQSPRQPSPPKTAEPVPEKSESELAKTTPALTEDETTTKSEAAALVEPQQQEKHDLSSELAPGEAKITPPSSELTCREISAETIPSQPAAIDAAVFPVVHAPKDSQLPVTESGDSSLPKNDNEQSNITTTTTTKDISISQSPVVPPGDTKLEEKPSKTDYPETPAAAAIVTGKDEPVDSQRVVKVEQTTASSEISSDSPVPIQVAESVLEADVKESVTEDLRPVTEEAIASIAVSAQESVPAVLETAMEAVCPTTATPNGTAVVDPSLEIGNGIDGLNLTTSTRLTSPQVAVAERVPEVTAAPPITQQVSSIAQEGESCSLPAAPIETIPAAQILSDIQQPSPTSVIPAEKTEELKLPTATEQQLSPTETAEEPKLSTEIVQSIQTLDKPIVQAEEPKLLTETEQPIQTPVAPVEKAEEPKLTKETEQPIQTPVATVEKAAEPKVSTETIQSSITPVVPSEPVEDIKLATDKTEPSVTAEPQPLSVTEKLISAPIETAEKSEEPKSPTKTEIPSSTPTASTESSSEAKSPTETPILCPIKSEKKARDTDLPVKAEEDLSPSLAALVIDSKSDTTSPIKQSSDKKVPKSESKDSETAEDVGSQSESSEESPIRPTRTKDLQIPDTPTVIEATPPTSPPIGGPESTEEQPTKTTKKVVKKTTKKTTTTTSETKPAEGTEPVDPEGKKVGKKVVKKVVKKTTKDEDGAAESTNSDKTKKAVKIVKKGAKQQNLETDTAVPETPPPGTSETPVPPKRKVKSSTNTKPDSGKSDFEP